MINLHEKMLPTRRSRSHNLLIFSRTLIQLSHRGQFCDTKTYIWKLQILFLFFFLGGGGGGGGGGGVGGWGGVVLLKCVTLIITHLFCVCVYACVRVFIINYQYVAINRSPSFNSILCFKTVFYIESVYVFILPFFLLNLIGIIL